MKKIDWTNHILEFVTVVVGILLAFGLNAFYENQKEANIVDKQLQGIKQEVERNLAEINQKLIYHQGLIDSLRINPENVMLRLKAPNLKNAAWRIAENVAFRDGIDYDLYKNLIDIYQIQDKLNEHSANAGELMSYLNIVGPYHKLNLFLNKDKLDRAMVVRELRGGWVYIFEDTVSWEKELQLLYKQVLEKL